jgi:hypothetical protein
MCVYPKKYDKEDFLNFLEKNNVNDTIISKFVELPETIVRSGNTYKLDINSTWYGVGDTFYNFELNYYSEELVEYLFNSKVFNDIELNINYLMCELMNRKLIKGWDCK